MAQESCQPTDEPHGYLVVLTRCAEAAATDLEDQSPLPWMGEGLLPSRLRDGVGSLQLQAVSGLFSQLHTA